MRLFQGRAGGITERCYATLLDQARGAERVLEFGPGGSTFAFIEAGAREIVTCEHDGRWLGKARKRFAAYPQVKVLAYSNAPDVSIEGLADRRFDFAFVDSPAGNHERIEQPGQEGLSRLNTMLYALAHAPVALLHDTRRDGEVASLRWLQSNGYNVDILPGRGNIARVTHAD